MPPAAPTTEGPETPPVGARQREAIRQVHQLIQARTQAESTAQRELKLASNHADESLQEATQRATRGRDESLAAVDLSYETSVKTIADEFESSRATAKREAEAIRERVSSELDAAERGATRALKEKIWAAETIYEANQGKPEAEFQQTKKQIEKKLNDLVAIETLAGTLLHEYHRPIRPEELTAATRAVEPEQSPDPAAEFDRRAEEGNRLTRRLSQAALPRMSKNGTLIVLAIIFVAGMSVLGAWSQQWKLNAMVGAAAGAAAVFSATAVWALVRAGRAGVGKIRGPLIVELVGARHAAERWLTLAGARRDAHARSLADARDAEVLEAKGKHEPVIADVRRRRTEETARLQEHYALRRSAIDHTREETSAAAAEQRRAGVAAATEQFTRAMADAEQAASDARAAASRRHADRLAALESDWKSGMARLHETIDGLWNEVKESYRPWSDPAWATWTPPAAPATHLAFGEFRLDRSTIPGGAPSEPRLALPTPPLIRIPASLALPDQCSVILKHAGAEDPGRVVALRTLQAIMVRLLTSLPPGKARFIIFDPVGLGENFAGFMHLADHDEALVGGKIWTEARHVEQRLADLTEHMENVIQKYLRNEFRTIAEYNEQAGEIAEPYRFLVIADFPAGFSEASCSRLASVVNSGSRCGVHTLLSLDSRLPLPAGVSLADIEKNSVRLAWRRPPAPGQPAAPAAAPLPAVPGKKHSAIHGPSVNHPPAAAPGSAANSHEHEGVHAAPRIVWEEPELAPVPLVLDEPPGEELFNRLIHDVGAAAKRSSRVQVPFSTIAPDPAELWTMDSAEELRVPLGRAGATKLQYLTLGRGTSQHALIAGKTGSGKSTLLNAIVTNLSMWYSPDQVQFYLIDFKKGVEFKSYATHELAHARAVAIESDREFGLSVLQRLDNELKRRGNLFRDLGVQDLRGFRGRNPDEPMPRILLIIDEFQEFFTEDDKLSQDATLLLDRLVRQGRAFGMHVILGSQTLSGAFSLARSTMGQMGVRIALQCSEADSYVILNEDNAAARLLSRPGEAIYNDASGLVEGNSPFQIAWLPDEQREEYLKRVSELAGERRHRVTERQAVFEGNVPADISRNLPLANLLAETSGGTALQNSVPGGTALHSSVPGGTALQSSDSDAPQSSHTSGGGGRTGEAPSGELAVRARAASNVLKVWLGDAIAIKDPTAAVLRRQAGSNIVIVGQREETATALFAAAMIGLAAQLPGEPSAADSTALQIPGGTAPQSPGGTALESSVPGSISLQSSVFGSSASESSSSPDETAPPGSGSSEHAATPGTAGSPPSLPTFFLLDPTPPDSSLFGVLESIGGRLPRGHVARGVSMKAVPEALSELVAELRRRHETQDASAATASSYAPRPTPRASHSSPPFPPAPPAPPAPRFLLINGIQKYRALRRPDDDFSFSMDADKAPSPDKMLAEILREGPGVGIHVIIWCDTAPNLTRALDRQGLREFDYRVLMQMSQADSATLIDTPEAGKLGLHRALLHSEEQGFSEKFRPYALPGEGWMREVSGAG